MAEPWISVYAPDGINRGWRMLMTFGWVPVLGLWMYAMDNSRIMTLLVSAGVAMYLLFRFWRYSTLGVSTHPRYVEISNIARTHRIRWNDIVKIRAQVQDVEQDEMLSVLGFNISAGDQPIPEHLYMPRDENGNGPHILRAIVVETVNGPVSVDACSTYTLDLLLDAWASAEDRKEAFDGSPPETGLDDDGLNA